MRAAPGSPAAPAKKLARILIVNKVFKDRVEEGSGDVPDVIGEYRGVDQRLA